MFRTKALGTSALTELEMSCHEFDVHTCDLRTLTRGFTQPGTALMVKLSTFQATFASLLEYRRSRIHAGSFVQDLVIELRANAG